MAEMLTRLEQIILDRKANPQANSYTNRLLDAGTPKIAQKVGEEAVEVIVAALAQPRERQVSEFADLFYHTLVLLADLGISLDEICAELDQRHKAG